MIPDFQTIMLPLMRILEDKQEHSLQELHTKICDNFNLSEEERNELVPSAVQTKIYNRVVWALTHLRKAKLIEAPRRTISVISNTGLDLLRTNPNRIDLTVLKNIPDYQSWIAIKGIHAKSDDKLIDDFIETRTPEELLEDSYSQLKDELADEIITKIKECSPNFFERLVVDLLLKMGYGGTKRGNVIGISGDGGIDGIIDEDKLGLDSIYIQAKRWDNVVGRPQIQGFVGALAGQGAKKGIFITTSSFTKEALEYQPMNDTKIVLIDGNRLANLMIEHNVGVTTKINYEVKKIDNDYFEEL
jgi:restriction system protein